MQHSHRPNRRGLFAVILAALSPWLVFSAAWAQPPGMPQQNRESGLSINDPQAFQGYSLVAPLNSTTTYLIDMKGHVVNRWESEFSLGASAYLLENGHLLRTGEEHGGSINAGAPGGRLQEFSWEGELLWDYSLSTERLRPHHDICPMPNGNVLVIAWDKKTPEEAIAAGRIPETIRDQFLPDCVLEVQPTGKASGEIVWQWHAWDHLIQDVDESKPNYGEVAEHPELIDINFGTNVMASMIKDPEQLAKLRALGYVGGGRDGARGSGGLGGPGQRGGPPMTSDWMHTNSIDYNPELDQIMLCVHEFSEVWIIDHSTTTEEAASHRGGRYGKGGDLLYRWGNPRAYRNGINADQRLYAQHCAHWIPKGVPGEGNMLVFNNGNGRPDGEYSSVDEVVLPVDEYGNYLREEYLAFGPERAAWSYFEPEQGAFLSRNISGAQRLPNGNTFICSGAQGLLFEVTQEKETVWKYSIPVGIDGPPPQRDPRNRPDRDQRGNRGGPDGLGGPGTDPPGFGPPRPDGNRPNGTGASDRQDARDDHPHGPDMANRDRGPGRPDDRHGGPGGRPGDGPGGPGGIFTCNRYGLEHPGIADKEIKPGDDLLELIGAHSQTRRPEEPR